MTQVLPFYQTGLYAEQCSRSLLTMLSNWGAQGPFVVASWENQESLNFDEMNKNLDQFKNLPGGLYFIFCRAESSRFVYPVYVGMTSQSFYARLSQQKYQVLSDISSDKWEINFCKKFVVYVKFVSTPTAKFLESIFLAAFNFARNIMENIGTRNIDKNAIETPVDGIKHFKDILMDEIARLNNAIN